MKKPIYLDYHATTPVDPRVFSVMKKFFLEDFGNPGSNSHEYGDIAAKAMNDAREEIGIAMNSISPSEVIFVSGATEANNLAIHGTAIKLKEAGKPHIITSAIEHKAVLDVTDELERQGFQLTYVNPNPEGVTDPQEIERAITPKTGLISIMHANNEIGIINDIKRGITEANDDASIVDGLKGLFDELNILHESHEDALNAKSVFDQNAKRNADKDGSDIFDKLTEITEKMVRARAAKRNLSKNSSLSDDDLKRPEKCYSYIIAEKAQDKFIEKIGGMSDMLKDVQANQILQKVITTAKDKALIHLKDHLKKLTNQKLKETLSDGSQIEVLEIDKFVQLGWNNIKQSEGSGAQNIIVAYSFARSVLEEASIEFPLIVDHPVAQVDTANRESLGATLASMMHQFIGFLIDTERPGFLEGVNSGGDVHYISLFSDIKGNAAFIDSIKKINNDETYITDNGYLCYNKDFFIENSMGVGNV